MFNGGRASAAVLEDFDELSAGAEEKDRAELRVEAAAEDQLVAVAADHRLDGHSQEMAGSGALAHRRLDRSIGVAHGFGAGEVELNAADVGLVRDRLRVELEYHRIADRLGRRDRGLRIRGDSGCDGRHAVSVEKLLRLRLGQHRPPGAAGCRADRLGAGAVTVVLGEGRGLVEAAEVVGQPPHRVEDASGGVGIGEGRDSRLVEDRLARGDVGAAHPARQDGFALDPAKGRSASAVCVGSVIAWGVKIASRPSLPGSMATTFIVWT